MTLKGPGTITPAKDGGSYVMSAALTKYAPDGSIQWKTPCLSLDVLQTREGGNGVYVLGLANRGLQGQNDYLLVKFDLTGRYLFSKEIGPQLSTGWTPRITVDFADNVYFSLDSVLTKFDSGGNFVWRSRTVAPADVDNAIQFDSLRNLLITAADGTLKKVDSDGQLLWQLGFSNFALSVASDDSVSVSVQLANNPPISKVVKVSSSGTVLWSQQVLLNDPEGTVQNADGTTYAFGLDRATEKHYWFSLSSTGALLWTRQEPFWTYGDGKNDVAVVVDHFVNEYNAANTLLATYDIGAQLGIDGQTVRSVLPSKGYLYCVFDNVGGDPSVSGAAKLTFNGAVVWSNKSTTNTDVAVDPGDHTNFFGILTKHSVKGCVTPNGTTFMMGPAPSGIGPPNAVVGVDAAGKKMFATFIAGGTPNILITEPDGGVLAGDEASVSRLDATGHLLWTAPGGVSDVVLDGNGNALCVRHGLVRKVSPTGQILWSYDVKDTSIESCAVGPSNSVYVAGGAGEWMWCIGSGGSLVFSKIFSDAFAPDTALPTEICSDSSGNAYLTYNLFSTGSTQGWVRKVDSTGKQLWVQILSYGLNSPVVQSALDPAGTLYTVGQSQTNGVPQMIVFSVQAGSGALNWSKGFTLGGDSSGTDVQVDKDGNVLVGGWSYSGGSSFDRALLKLDTSGLPLQTVVDDSGFSLHDDLGGFGVDNSGNAYLFGLSVGPALLNEFQVNKYGPPVPLDATVTLSASQTMVLGLAHTVTIATTNVGTNLWTSLAGYKLDCLEPGTWGVTSVALSSNDAIGYGNVKSFAVNVMPPTTPGLYPLQWRMEQSGVQFGAPSNTVMVNVVAQTNFASFVAQTVPTSIVAGQSYPVTLQFKNTGQNTWTSALGYDLISLNPGGNLTWGTSRIPLVNGPVGPGGTATYSRTVIAPMASGTYNFQWMPIQESLSTYGPTSPNLAIVVAQVSDAARFVVQSGVPTTIVAGASFSPTMTFQNVGFTPWTVGNYLLRSRNPYNNATWGTAGLALPANIPAGSSVSFHPSLVAPATPGTYNFQWSMLHYSAGTLFGDVPANAVITVTPAAKSAAFVSQTPVPTSMAPGNSFAASITMKNVGTGTWDSTYALASLNANWGVSSIPVIGTVASGASFTFTGAFTAPTTPGSYHFIWQMNSGGMFGQQTPDILVVVSTDAATYVSDNEPVSVNAGTDFGVVNTMLNAGTTTWSNAAGYSMMSTDPANNVVWSRNRAYMSATGTSAPGTQTVFYALCTAPILPGTYPMQWQMDKSGVPFGQATPIKMIKVVQGADDAQYMSEVGIPASFPHSTAFGCYFVMKNLGTATWDSTYTLVPISTPSFGVSSIAAPSTAPGASGSFAATFTTPATPGAYHFQFRMMHGGVKFGQATVDVVITVT